MNHFPLIISLITAGVLCMATACVRVKSHQREMLAHPAMQGPVWSEESKALNHVLTIREATEGATGSAGGGCGCN